MANTSYGPDTKEVEIKSASLSDALYTLMNCLQEKKKEMDSRERKAYCA
jgi:hypothetical protein